LEKSDRSRLGKPLVPILPVLNPQDPQRGKKDLGQGPPEGHMTVNVQKRCMRVMETAGLVNPP